MLHMNADFLTAWRKLAVNLIQNKKREKGWKFMRGYCRIFNEWVEWLFSDTQKISPFTLSPDGVTDNVTKRIRSLFLRNDKILYFGMIVSLDWIKIPGNKTILTYHFKWLTCRERLCLGGGMADHTTHFCRTWFHQVQHIPGSMKCFSIINQLWGTSLHTVYVKFRLTTRVRCF